MKPRVTSESVCKLNGDKGPSQGTLEESDQGHSNGTDYMEAPDANMYSSVQEKNTSRYQEFPVQNQTKPAVQAKPRTKVQSDQAKPQNGPLGGDVYAVPDRSMKHFNEGETMIVDNSIYQS